ncbi:MAG: hypothetical protein JST34_05520 [Bacteroidetes bacterium]|nr:hypothetical protein [Bacteroidota bacterium]
MKKIISFTASLVIAQLMMAQTNTNAILLLKGQKISVNNDVTIDADLGMGMQLNSVTASINSLQVKDSDTNNYTISNTLTKLKINMNMMGQNNTYDSDNKDGNNADMAKIFDDKMNKVNDVMIDKTTGAVITPKQAVIKDSDEDANNISENMMKMFSNTSDVAVVEGAFEILPTGKKTGDSWADTSKTADTKTIRTYTLQSVTGNEAVMNIETTVKATNKLDFQGMEFEINTDTKTTGQVLFDISTGLVKKRDTVSDITGSFQMMGQDMPITAKTTTKTVYN